jgi:HK97 family phage major capsid protein
MKDGGKEGVKESGSGRRDPALAALEELEEAVRDSFDTLETDIKKTQSSVTELGSRLKTVEDADWRRKFRESAQPVAARRFLVTASGEKIPLLTRADRFAEFSGGPELPGVGLGDVVRGVVTGRWTDEAEKAAAGSSTTGGGVLLAPSVSARFIDLARSQARVLEAGAVTAPMPTRDVVLAKLAADPSVYWRPENAAITAADLTFAAVTLRSRTCGAIVKVPLELVEDAANLNSIVEGVLAAAIGNELDRVALVGSGAAEEPLGIQNTTGVGTDTSVGSPVWDDLITAAGLVMAANGKPNAVIMHPRDLATLAKLKWTNGDYYTVPAIARDLTLLPSTVVPSTLGGGSNESLMFTGQWDNLLLGMRQTLLIEASREAADSSTSAFSNAQVWIRALLRADVAVLRPGFFTVSSGVTA